MNGPKDFEKHIKSQLSRIEHLPGYPESSIAIRDYIAALSIAATQEAATRVMDAVTAEDWARCPTASRLRTMAYEQVSEQRERERKCDFCGGSGFLTVWRLVAYHGKSFQIKRSECIDADNAISLADKLTADPIGTDRQQVLSAADNCICRRVT